MERGLIDVNLLDLLLQIINITLLFFLLRHFLFRPVTNFMEGRTREIQEALDDAAAKEKAAQALKREYEEVLGGARDEAREIIGAAARGAKEQGDKLEEEARERADHLLRQARQKIEEERRQAMEDLGKQVSFLSVRVASRVLRESLTQEVHQQLVDNFIERLGNQIE